MASKNKMLEEKGGHEVQPFLKLVFWSMFVRDPSGLYLDHWNGECSPPTPSGVKEYNTGIKNQILLYIYSTWSILDDKRVTMLAPKSADCGLCSEFFFDERGRSRFCKVTVQSALPRLNKFRAQTTVIFGLRKQAPVYSFAILSEAQYRCTFLIFLAPKSSLIVFRRRPPSLLLYTVIL